MEDKIKDKLLKIAEEKATEKINQEREKYEQKIREEIQYVEIILKMIEKKMLYKVTDDDRKYQKFILITKDIFLDDYMNEPKEHWYPKGIQLKDYKHLCCDNYEVDIRVNGIRYKHIGSIIKEFEGKLKEKTNRISSITENLKNLENEFIELVNEEKNIKKFIEDYKETERAILDEV